MRRSRRDACRKIIIPYPGVDLYSCERVLGRQHARVLKANDRVNMLVVEFDEEPAAKTVSQASNLFRVEEDLRISICSWGLGAVALMFSQKVPWGINHVKCREVKNLGDPVEVAVLDTGIDMNHPDLRGLVAGGVNTINPELDANDDNGHGTHVAGTIAALDNDFGVVGVKPNTRLYAVKVLDKDGEGYLSDLIEGLQWSADQGVKVVNMSLSSSEGSTAFHTAIRNAYLKGITTVAAAGNSGPDWDTVRYPARYSEVIAVGAIDQKNQLPKFSSRGRQVAILAPGVDVLSTWRGGTYATKSGTSMAAPHVTGAVALMLANGRNLTPDLIKRVLVGTAASPSAGSSWSVEDNVGILDVASAVAAITEPKR